MAATAPSPVHKAKVASWRVRTPTLIQMEAVECGAVALGIILHTLKKYEPFEALREKCGISRNGSKAANLLRAARELGLEANGYRRSTASVLRRRQPVILFWNFNHFVVLEGCNRRHVFINDPATGPRKVSQAEFDESFTGVCLEFTPGPGFQTGGRAPGVAEGLRRRARGYGPAISFAILTGLLLVLPGLLFPLYSKIFLDEILVNRLENWLRPLLLAMGLTVVFQAVMIALQQYYLLRMQTKMALAGSARFFWHLFRLPLAFFDQRYAGDLGARVQSNDAIAGFLAGPIASAGLNLLMIGFYAALMFAYDWVLTLIGVAVVLLNVVTLRFVARIRRDQSIRLTQESAKYAGAAQNGLAGIETVKASGSENDLFSLISGHVAKIANSTQRLAVPTTYLGASPVFLQSVAQFSILGIGGLRVMEGELSIGALVAFQILMGNFISPVNRIMELGGQMQEITADIRRVDDAMNYPPEKADDHGASTGVSTEAAPEFSGLLEVRNLTFGYSRLEPPLIENLGFTVRPGTRVALVGATGSGKSTIGKLVLGLYQPWEGQILFDGQPRENHHPVELARMVSMVDQDIFLFAGSVRENLTMWRHGIPEEDITQAAHDACVHEVVAARPGSYESQILEGGANFSGGQRQRLEIARALVTRPALLVLDEATSALDPETESLIDRNLRRRGCACLMIAHRLSTIRDCDEILVLDQGKLVERGTHQELLVRGGAYAALIQG